MLKDAAMDRKPTCRGAIKSLTYEGTSKPEIFSPSRLTDKRTSDTQWLDLSVPDKLINTNIDNLNTANRGEIDYENLLEIDSDGIFIYGVSGDITSTNQLFDRQRIANIVTGGF